jgi:hypothetical protein
MNRWSAAICALVLSGCAQSALTAPLPVIDPGLAAEVIVIRPSGFKSCGVAKPVMIDGRQVFTLECGKHVVYPVPAGEHVFGVISYQALAGSATNITPMTIVAHQRYYLRLDSFVWTGATLEPITPEEGERLMTETSRLIAPAK